MWNRLINAPDTIVASAAISLVCMLLTQHFTSRVSEAYSEVLCWVILLILFLSKQQLHIGTTASFLSSSGFSEDSTSSTVLWAVAISIALVTCFKMEVDTFAFYPVLNPLILFAEKHFHLHLQASVVFNLRSMSECGNMVLIEILIAVFAVLTLSNGNLRESMISIIPIAIIILLYLTFIPKNITKAANFPSVNLDELFIPLSLRLVVLLVVLLGIKILVNGAPSIDIIITLFTGITKALFWYFVTRNARQISWSVATTITTFSILATLDPYIQSSESQAVSQVIATILTLGQLIHLLPKRSQSKLLLWGFAIVSLHPYLANIFAIKVAHSSFPSSFGQSQEHPVESLINNAKIGFESLIQRQSKNYTAACNEYKRRYLTEPPPGFQAWYNFAVAHSSPIIDDFDTISYATSPFLRLSGIDIVRTMKDVLNTPDSDLWNCTFRSGPDKIQCTHPYRTFDRHIELLFNRLLSDVQEVPDVQFLVNHLDEPRVLFPTASLHGEGRPNKRLIKLTDMSRRPTWDSITASCSHFERNKSLTVTNAVDTFSLPFVTDRSLNIDLCLNPKYNNMHGIFVSPTSFKLIEGMVPIMSTGSLSTMGDLLFPSPAYMEPDFLYNEAHDREWDDKNNNLYWAGSTTGGFAFNNHWRHFQRQRFVNLAQNLEPHEQCYLRERNGGISCEESSFLNGRLYDVAFTRILQCERKSCAEQGAYFRFKVWADKNRALQSRLVFDIDGNGISGRYYKLLASKSTPLKQTLIREWHDDRLTPWIHYIPVSQGMEELPELVLYLTSTTAGQQKAKQIADQGRKWFSQAFREIDLTVYVYRLFLELARVQDSNRQAISDLNVLL